MVNTECNVNGVAINGTVSTAQDNQLHASAVMKKTALRDVQNENLGSVEKQQKSLLSIGTKPSNDAAKFCGTKRPMPEVPSSSQALTSLPSNGLHENVMNARRRIDLELGRGRISNVESYAQAKKISQTWQDVPVMASRARNGNVKSNVVTPILAFSGPAPSFPSTFGKNGVSSEAGKVPKELPRTVHLKSTDEQLRMERYNNLQMYLKKCDDANQREYMQMLLHLSPDDLSKRAWELEKRAIKLALDESKEMTRQTSLNILAKPSASNNLSQLSKS